jgi:Fe-S cluster assembly protein SufD
MENKPGKQTEPQLEAFEQLERETRHPGWVFPLRKAGMARFAELGFPTLKDEDWRFTNVAPIAKLPFRPVLTPSKNALKPETLRDLAFGSVASHRLVFVDGHFVEELSSVGKLPKGVVVSSLARALMRDASLLEKHLGRYAQTDNNAFAALNSAFFQDGGFISVPEGTVVEQPIHLLFIASAQENGATTHPRNLVLAQNRSQFTVIESFVSTVEAQYFTNAVTELVLGDETVVEHCKFQDESPGAFHVAAIHAHLGRACRFAAHSIATGARLSRNNIRTGLKGEGLEAILNGLYITKGDQLADHHMVVEHAEPRGASHEYYNGILDGRSKGVFHGRILVRPDAQKTDAKQTNKNLLLSDEATVDTKPQLEIYADDVKCTHGATVGQLNEESIFYLRARGIGAETARRMLIHAFASEIIDRIRCAPVREELNGLIWNRLENNPHIAGAH